jgi:hypothetical protein
MSWQDEIQKYKAAQLDAAASDKAKYQERCMSILQILMELRCNEMLTDLRDTVWRCGEVMSFTGTEHPELGSMRASAYAPDAYRAGFLLQASWPSKFIPAHKRAVWDGRWDGDYEWRDYPNEIRVSSVEISILGVQFRYDPTVRYQEGYLTEAKDIRISIGDETIAKLLPSQYDSGEITARIRQSLVKRLAAMGDTAVHRTKEQTENQVALDLALHIRERKISEDDPLITSHHGLKDKVDAILKQAG